MATTETDPLLMTHALGLELGNARREVMEWAEKRDKAAEAVCMALLPMRGQDIVFGGTIVSYFHDLKTGLRNTRLDPKREFIPIDYNLELREHRLVDVFVGVRALTVESNFHPYTIGGEAVRFAYIDATSVYFEPQVSANSFGLPIREQ